MNHCVTSIFIVCQMIKSDICSLQKVFGFWKKLAKDLQKLIAVYYGVACLGKGLVDTAGGFGMKDPIRKAIIVKDCFFILPMIFLSF